MSSLEKALRQTQEMLEQITALRAALAQQAEPVVPMDAEIVHFAKTALHEMPRPATDWHHCAKRVCEAVVAAQQAEPVDKELTKTAPEVDKEQAEPVQAQAEPVMIYHGEYTIDCGNHGHHNVELLKLIAAGTKLYAGPRHPEPVSTDQAARLALDALTEMTQLQRTASESDRYKRVKAAMSALESALSKQAEPVAEPDDACGNPSW